MTNIIENEDVKALVAARLKANSFTPDAFADFIRFHIDGEIEQGDGISSQIVAANQALAAKFTELAGGITTDDIQPHLNRVTENDPDWLAHLDIAFAMAQANPNALHATQLQQIQAVTAEPHALQGIVSIGPNIRPVQAGRFIADIIGLRAA